MILKKKRASESWPNLRQIMIIYQIVIKGDARSEEYAAISRASFQPAIDAGFISEIKIFDAITPSSENFEEHVSRYNWAPSLMHADKKSGKKIAK